MLLIFLSYIYIFFLALSFGIGFNKLFGIKSSSISLSIICGLFSISILTTCFAFIGPINLYFHFIVFGIAFTVLISDFKRLKNKILILFNKLKSLSLFIKLLIGVQAVLVIMQCASAPYIIDNESYYIQTISWLNVYGFTEGLVNVHLFLGQQSGWHILQSALNFNFIYANFNDLSGFLLLVANFWSLNKLDLYLKDNREIKYLIVGLFPLGTIFFSQFISAPSPDIAVYVFTFYSFWLFASFIKNKDKQDFIHLTVICLFTIFCKPTSIVLGLLPLYLLLKYYRILKTSIPKITVLGAIILTLFISKNIIITGYPLFPSHLGNMFNVDWKLPKPMLDTFFGLTEAYAFFITPQQYDSLSLFSKFKLWLTLPKLHGLFNVLVTLATFVVPIIFWFRKVKSIYWFIYLVFIFQMVILFTTSPQYRFFFNLLFLLSCVCLATILIKRPKLVQVLIAIAISITAMPLLGQFNIQSLSSNSYSESLSSFQLEYIIFPHKNSKLNTAFTTETIGNLKYSNPTDIDFFWGTGDGCIPVLRKEQLEYFDLWFHYIPQQRTDNLKDGFYSKKTVADD